MSNIIKGWSKKKAQEKVDLIIEEHSNHVEWLKEQLLECYENEAWVALGMTSWSSFLKSLAATLNKSSRHLWRLHSENKKELEGSTDKTTGLNEAEPEDYDDVIVVFDQTGRQVPPELATLFDKSNNESDTILRKVYEVNAQIIACIKDDDIAWARFNRSKALECLKDLKSFVKFSRPWAYCPICGGDGNDGLCDTCKGSGWLVYMQWDKIPTDQKNI